MEHVETASNLPFSTNTINAAIFLHVLWTALTKCRPRVTNLATLTSNETAEDHGQRHDVLLLEDVPTSVAREGWPEDELDEGDRK